MNFVKLSFFLFFTLLFSFVTGQQNTRTKEITDIEIQIIGPQTVGKSFILQNLQVEQGAPYDPLAVDRSIRNLIETGAIADVRAFIDPVKSADKTIGLLFKVTTKPRIKSITFLGNDALSDKKLSKTISLKEGDLLTQSTLNKDRKVIEELYLDKGYWDTIINFKVEQTDDRETVRVVFDISESEKRKIRKIQFNGNATLDADELLDEMETAPWRFWRFWSKRSLYRPEIFEEDLEKILSLYNDNGFLEASISEEDVQLVKVGKSRMDLIIKLVEGERSYFGESTITGNVVLSSEEF